jgi:hypothetical protein
MKEWEASPEINGVSRRQWMPSNVVFWRCIVWCRRLLEINKYEDYSYGMWRRVTGWVVFDVSEDPAALIFVVRRCKKCIPVEPLATYYTASRSKSFDSITTVLIATDLPILNTFHHWRSKPKFDLETCRIRFRGGRQLTASTFGRMGTAVVYVWLRIAWKTQCGSFATIVRIDV